MRTLVVSDLHLGARILSCVLTQRAPLSRLLEALDGVDRLVLLGDVVELLERRTTNALHVAEPVLRSLGRTMGPGREIILVPGNHDRALVRRWIRTHGPALVADTAVPLDATPALAQVTSWLAPASASVRYPGVWLSDRVWATHGHYLDRHLLPESAFGVARGLLGRLPRDGASPSAYELAGGVSVTSTEALLTRALPRPLATLVEDLAELVRASTMPLAPRRLLHPRMARATAVVLGTQMRRASIPALARVVHRLGIGAEWVVFGHVHRLGPLGGDRLKQWQGPGGRPRIANSGSWVYEPLLVHRARAPHPYWPGGAILLDDDLDPVALGLLDDLPASSLH
jgi:UDP-2,3-diacylglucosamine pyrophosphatase LpxH